MSKHFWAVFLMAFLASWVIRLIAENAKITAGKVGIG